MMRFAVLISMLVCAGESASQRELHTEYGTVPNGELGTVLRAVGDVDGDGTTDFVVTEPSGSTNGSGRAYVVSGRTHGVLATFQGQTAPGIWGLGERDASPIGDVDGDGSIDFAIGYLGHGILDVFSGASGSRLHRLGPALEYGQWACSAGDLDGDGLDDFVAPVYLNNDWNLWALRGVSGTQLRTLTTATRSYRHLRNVGDLNGDGHDEIVSCGDHHVEVYDVFAGRMLRQVQAPYTRNLRSVETADWNGDGHKDLLLGYRTGSRLPFLYVLSLWSGGTLLRSYSLPADDTSTPSGHFGILPDMDGDGQMDLVVSTNTDPIVDSSSGCSTILSGATGERLGAWAGRPTFRVTHRPIAGLGDVDGDGFGDFVVANPDTANNSGGWQIVSGQILGVRTTKPVHCYSGVFAPELGISPPVLGSNMLVAGRDAPSGALCTVALSLRPQQPTRLGVAGCDLWFDISSWTVLANPSSAPNWQFSVPLPNLPALMGLEVALQAFYEGTGSAIGADLTNGVWARLGY